jgi:hypothetical protein
MRHDTVKRDAVGRTSRLVAIARFIASRSTASRITASLLFLSVAVAACLYPATATSQAQCRVLDPELQGTYSGGCRDGLAEGVGEATGMAQYKGEFRVGRKHGKGVKTWPSGDRYEGDFVADRKEGTGTYVWGPGSTWAGEKYTGSYRADLRHGRGVYEWPGGDRYDGPWENDRITGPATPRMLARARAHAEHVVAVGRPGVRVCRDLLVGSVTRDRVRGTVAKVDADRIAVRIIDPGRFPHTIGNVALAKGATVWDEIMAWTPCL